MIIRKIVEKYLRDNSYDGLFNEEDNCACDLNGLLSCCDSTFSGEDIVNCKPGYKIIITEKNKQKYEESDSDIKTGDWLISPKKQDREKKEV
jgi:hypothetical protein